MEVRDGYHFWRCPILCSSSCFDRKFLKKMAKLMLVTDVGESQNCHHQEVTNIIVAEKIKQLFTYLFHRDFLDIPSGGNYWNVHR